MRFLLGLILGAGAVLLLAEGLAGDVDWRARLDAAVTSAGQWVERARDAAARDPAIPPSYARARHSATPAPDTAQDTAPHPAEDMAPYPAEDMARHPAEGTAEQDPAPPPVSADAAPLADLEPARQPIPRPPDPQPMEPALPDPVAVQSADTEAVQPLVETGSADAPSPAGQAGAPPAAADGPPKSQTVWVPFHSEMSASGFAARLTQSVDHPFRVVRQGPGRYQVVFPYRDEPQRQALLAEAAAATGLAL